MRYGRGVAMGLLFVAAGAVTVHGATRSVTVSPESVAPGDRVTVKIHEYGGMWWGTDLYMVLASRAEGQGPCGAMSGAFKVAELAWTHDELVHDGLAEFTMPNQPDGVYLLAEDVPGVTCFLGGTITVSAGGNSNTAMRRHATGSATVMTMAELMLLLVAGGLASYARNRGLRSE
jgi:hypothetical protein